MTDGTHVRGSVREALSHAKELDCTATQIMLHNPRAYFRPKEEQLSFQEAVDLHILSDAPETLTVHGHAAVFCVLSKDPSDQKQRLARESLVKDAGDLLRLNDGVHSCLTTHPGSIKSSDQVDNVIENTRRTAEKMYERCGTSVSLLLENCVNHGLHNSLEWLHSLVERIDMPNVGITLDTAHAYGAGVDLSETGEVREWVAPYTKHIRKVHFNNSRYRLGSNRDGHGALSDGDLDVYQVENQYRTLRLLLPSIPFVIESTEDPAEVEMLHAWNSVQPSPAAPAADTST